MFPTLEKQLELVRNKNAIMKQQGNLVLFKYHRNVMYDYLWSTDEALMECRGHVYDLDTGNIVQAAPRKSFNYLENGWWKDVPLDTLVYVEKKYNGYLACATLYKGELLVTTTGSFSGEYQEIAKKMITESKYTKSLCDHFTMMFEICAEFDPHIVSESFGVKPLGQRTKLKGDWLPYITEESYCLPLSSALKLVDNCRHEGYMLTSENYGVCKLKSPYYVGKKKLMRMGPTMVNNMYSNMKVVLDQLPPMWYDVPYQIVDHFSCESWKAMDDQQRREHIETLEV